MSGKRTAQTAAKRAREQAVREKRERKAEKKRAAILARTEAEAGATDEHSDSTDAAEGTE